MNRADHISSSKPRNILRQKYDPTDYPILMLGRCIDDDLFRAACWRRSQPYSALIVSHHGTDSVSCDSGWLTPISSVPPNVEFFIDDLESEWTFVQPFDFIYMRMLTLTGSIRDWDKLFCQSFQYVHISCSLALEQWYIRTLEDTLTTTSHNRHLTPGAYIELHDPSNPLRSDYGTLPKDSALNRWNDFFLEASIKLGAPMNSCVHTSRSSRTRGSSMSRSRSTSGRLTRGPRIQSGRRSVSFSSHRW